MHIYAADVSALAESVAALCDDGSWDEIKGRLPRAPTSLFQCHAE